mgnify:CR=1 FL=1
MSKPLSPEEVEQYGRDGYLIVADLLTSGEVDDFVRYEAERESTEPRGLQCHREDGRWKGLAHHPQIAGIVGQLLAGRPRVVQTMYMNKPPQGGTGIALHQDTHYIRNEPNSLMACWLALSDTDEENGGLCVVPGSHRRGLYAFERVRDTGEHTTWETVYEMSGPDGAEWEENMHSFDIVGLEEEDIVRLSVPIGAGVFFTGMTVHGSYANRSSDRPRRAFAIHYVGAETWIYRRDLQDPVPVEAG